MSVASAFRRKSEVRRASSHSAVAGQSWFHGGSMQNGVLILGLVLGTTLAAQQQPNPRQQPGAMITMFAPEQHDLYDGHYVVSASRIYMVGGLNDPVGWDHLDQSQEPAESRGLPALLRHGGHVDETPINSGERDSTAGRGIPEMLQTIAAAMVVRVFWVSRPREAECPCGAEYTIHDRTRKQLAIQIFVFLVWAWLLRHARRRGSESANSAVTAIHARAASRSALRSRTSSRISSAVCSFSSCAPSRSMIRS